MSITIEVQWKRNMWFFKYQEGSQDIRILESKEGLVIGREKAPAVTEIGLGIKMYRSWS